MMRHRTVNMEARWLVIFSVLIAQVLCAPNRCTEFCGGQQAVGSSYEQSSSYRSHSKVVQGGSAQSSNHLNYDYHRPGNWTEHNEYVTDGGHGKVYEEKGQYVEGPKRVTYYKKNYSSSHSSGDVGALDVLNRIDQSASGVHAVGHEYEYDRHRQRQQVHLQPASQVINHREGHEEYGQYQTSQFSQHGQTESQVIHGQTDSQLIHGQNQQIGVIPDTHWGSVHNNLQRQRVSMTDQGGSMSHTAHNRPVEVLVNTHQISEPVIISDEQRSENGYQKSSSRRVYGQTATHADRGRLVSQAQVYQPVGIEPIGVQSIGVQPIAVQPIAIRPIAIQPVMHGSNSHSMLTSESLHDDTQRTQMNIHHTDMTEAMSNSHLGRSTHGQHTIVYPSTSSGHVQQYEAHWQSSGRVHGAAVPQSQITSQSLLHNSGLDKHYQWVPTGQLTTGAIDLGQVSSHSVDCTNEAAEHVSRYHRLYKRNVKTGRRRVPMGDYFHDHRQRPSTYPTDGTQTQEPQVPAQTNWGDLETNKYSGYHHVEKSEDEQQQSNGFGVHNKFEHNHVPKPGRVPIGGQKPEDFTQETEDLQQHTGGFEHFTTGKPKEHIPKNQHLEDFGHHDDDVEAGGFDDFTQQTSGYLEFGQHTQEPQYPGRIPHVNQDVTDFTQGNEHLQQHTGGFDDFTQQSSANLEFGQHTQEPTTLASETAHNSHSAHHGHHHQNFEQQTGDFNYSSQISENHELGQHTRDSGSLISTIVANPLSVDHGYAPEYLRPQTEDTNGFSQTSENHEFGQHVSIPRKPGHHDQDFTQQNEDMQQHTGGLDDLSQQTFTHHEFGQHTQKPQSIEQVGHFDDFSQQTSANLEFGQHKPNPHKPGHPEHDFAQHNEDLQQHTGGFDDFTQQTSSNLEFGQQTHHSQNADKIPVDNQHLDNFGTQNKDLEQQTSGFSHQSSANLEFGHQSQKPQTSDHLSQSNQEFTDFTQQGEDLRQVTGGFDDFTQQTSGNFEFGQNTQKPHKLQTPTGNQHLEDFNGHDADLEQQTGGFDDFTQQTSGNLEFGQHTQKPQRPAEVPHNSQHLDDFTQQTSGSLEFGHHTYKPGTVSTNNQQEIDELQQHTGGFDDFSQQASANLELGQQTWKPSRAPGSIQQETEDLQQHTGSFDDFTQQTSGNIEFGQQTEQNLDNLQQHTGGFDDFTQQSSGKLELGHQEEKTESPVICQSSICRKPAPKPTPKPRPGRGSRYGLETQRKPVSVQQPKTQSTQQSFEGIQQNPIAPVNVHVEDDAMRENLRGDQVIDSSTEKTTPVDDNQQVTDGQQVQQTFDDWTSEWHQRHKPSDLTSEYTQQHSSVPDFMSQSQTHYDQDAGLSQQQQEAVIEQIYQKPSDHYEQSQVSEEQKINKGLEQETDKVEIKPEPRIVEAYGGSGPYDPTYDEDIYKRIIVNPSATLPPPVEEQPWIIREKPREVQAPPVVMAGTIPEPIRTTEAPSSFWGRVGHKITSTFDKAKEKAKEVFG